MTKAESFFLEGKNNLGILLCHTLAGDPSQMTELGKKLNRLAHTNQIQLY